MTRYLLYFLTGFAHALVILIYRGYMGITPTMFSTMALVSAMVLFGIASWLELFLERVGAVTALLCVLAIAPWTIDAGRKVLAYDAFLSGVLIITHAVLLFFALATLITSMRYVVGRGSWISGASSPDFTAKIILSAIPLLILITWFLIMERI